MPRRHPSTDGASAALLPTGIRAADMLLNEPFDQRLRGLSEIPSQAATVCGTAQGVPV